MPGKKGAQLTPIPPRLGQGLQMRSSTFSGKGSHELAVRAPTNLRSCHEMRRGSTCTVWTCWQHISNTLATHLVDLYCVDLVGKLYFFTCWQAFLAYRYLPHHTHTQDVECVLLRTAISPAVLSSAVERLLKANTTLSSFASNLYLLN